MSKITESKLEQKRVKQYRINTTKIQTIEDVANLLKALDLRIFSNNHDNRLDSIWYMLIPIEDE